MKTYYVAGLPFSDELYHHGIKGQKWGVRRFQNLDRTWTEEGKKRYAKGLVSTYQKIDGKLTKLGKEREKAFYSKFNGNIVASDEYAKKSLGDERYNKMANKWFEICGSEEYQDYSVLPKQDQNYLENWSKKLSNMMRSAALNNQLQDPKFTEAYNKNLKAFGNEYWNIFGRWKTTQMKSILSEIPEDQREIAYDWMRFGAWYPFR